MKKVAVKYALRKQELSLRHLKIQELVKLSDFDYKLFQFEYGMKFLDELFGTDKDLIKSISTCTTYWCWWDAEWNRWERELIEFINDHGPEISLKFWHDEMDALVGDPLTYAGFKNYVKIFHHVRL